MSNPFGPKYVADSLRRLADLVEREEVFLMRVEQRHARHDGYAIPSPGELKLEFMIPIVMREAPFAPSQPTQVGHDERLISHGGG